MPVSWKLFRIVCVFQMLVAFFYLFRSLIDFAQTGILNFLFQTIAFTAITWLSILALIILNNNYPDKPIYGLQKRIFNWLFVINFLLLSFLFALVFSEYAELNLFLKLTNGSIFDLPLILSIKLLTYIIMLLFQFLLLYGLYNLRRLIYINFKRKKFEFEDDFTV